MEPTEIRMLIALVLVLVWCIACMPRDVQPSQEEPEQPLPQSKVARFERRKAERKVS